MDELAQARVELTLLEEKAQGLLKQLLDVRATIATQRAKIDELSRTSLRPSPINCLPTEILVFILDLDVHTRRYPERKQELANVCQRWRDVILQTPCFWSTIYVASDASSINTHLERSRGTLLDIVIEGATFSPPLELLALLRGLDIVKACTHRWRSLLVTNSEYPFDNNGGNPEEEGVHELLTNFIADCMNHLHFHSLNSVTIFRLCDFGYLDFLSIARAPALEHLELDGLVTARDILNPVAMLKTLKLNFEAGPSTDHLSFWSLVPTQALTKLSLSGQTKSFLLQPNSLYFPSLMSLEMLRVTKTRPILDAIVTPKLEQFNCTSSHHDDLPSVILSGFRSKFANVRQLSFSCPETLGSMFHDDVMCFCEVFPGVHHVELNGLNWPYLFEPSPIRTIPGLNSHIRYPVDLWTELKGFTFNGLHSNWVNHDQLVAWLVHRRASSLQQLHVKVKRSHPKVVRRIDRRSIPLYEHLKENCILELDGFWSRGVSSFHITSSGNSFSIHS